MEFQKVKMLVFAMVLATLSAGFASSASAYDACAGNNSRACTDARNAYAEHHGGTFPGQAYGNYRGGYNYNRGNWNRTAHAQRHHFGRNEYRDRR